MTNYNEAKEVLTERATENRRLKKTDKPSFNQLINDHCYFLESEYNLTDYQKTLLNNYACKLQAK